MVLEQRCMPVLHLFQKCQEVATAFKKSLLGSLRKSSCTMCDQSWPIQPKSCQSKFARGSQGVEATVGEQ
jgi:hypothetical protein